MAVAVVDTSPLYPAADLDDDDRCIGGGPVTPRPQLVVPALVVAEATYLVGRRLGAKAEAAFLRRLGQIEREPPRGGD